MDILSLLQTEFAAIMAKVRGESKRATPYQAIYQTVQGLLEAAMPGQFPMLMDLYDDNGSLYCIASAGGKVYRAPVILTTDVNGTMTVVGALMEVPLFAARAGRMSIVRQADGAVRWFAIAATSVMNRVSEIDSRALFDSFVAHAEKTGDYPVLRFYHTTGLDFGTADYLAREGYAYLASGVLNMQHPIAQAFVDAIEQGRGTWGCSIGFLADEAAMTEVTAGIRIPVYHKGINREISVLPESDAASWYTAIGAEVSRMNERTRKALAELAGESPEMKAKIEAFIATVDTTNVTIEERGLITRAETAATPDPEPPIAAPVEVEQHATTDVEKAAKETAAQKAADRDELTAHVVKAAGVEDLAARVTKIEEMLAAMMAEQQKRSVDRATEQRNVDVRLAACEVILTQWQQTRAADMPAARTLSATYRPREQAPTTPAEFSTESAAQATLGKLK
jgi:hypothetical protein